MSNLMFAMFGDKFTSKFSICQFDPKGSYRVVVGSLLRLSLRQWYKIRAPLLCLEVFQIQKRVGVPHWILFLFKKKNATKDSTILGREFFFLIFNFFN